MVMEIETWLGKHLITAVISLGFTAIVGFSTVAYGFSQKTIETEATLKQHIAVLDNRMSTTERMLNEVKTDTRWIRDTLTKTMITQATLKAQSSN